jgi:hypothetical protein
MPMEPQDQDKKPHLSVEDAMAVNSVPDEIRMHANPDETATVQRGDGALLPVEDPHDQHAKDDVSHGEDRTTTD